MSAYCPNGHSWHKRGENPVDVERRKRERAEQECARLADMAAMAQRERNKAIAETKRHAKRSAAGVCPCCNRSFVALARHMKSKHPEFGNENVVKLTAAKA